MHGGIEGLLLIEPFGTRHCTVISFLERMVKYEIEMSCPANASTAS
jgi:hypothetical protein